MKKLGKGIKALKKAQTISMITLLILGTLVLAVTPPGEKPTTIPDWPDDDEWINYTFRGERIRDWEDKPSNDPTHGPANVQPDAVDIASGVAATGGGAENNPGFYTSVQYLYYDENGDSDGFDFIDDDWLFLRMRVVADPTHSGKYAYKSFHWDVLLEIDGDIWSEFVVDINGGDGYFGFGTVGVYYNNTEDYEYDPDNDWVWLQEASRDDNDFTNPREIDYGTPSGSDDQYWIEYRIPVTAFTDYDDNQLLGADTDFLLFFSTSASMTNPLQKDWMGEYIFGEPANITVNKTVEEDIVSPGDTIHYKIYYNNTGDFNANEVWINDTIPEYTTFLGCAPDYDTVDGSTYRWYFTDITPGNHTVYLNVTVDNDVPDGTILENVVALNYTDHNDNPMPETNDTTENPVSGPVMELAKEAYPTSANPGDIIEYTITYENTGSGGAYDLLIIDTIPDHTTFDHSFPNYLSESGGEYTWEIDYVAGYSTGTILIYVEVDGYTATGTSLENYVTLDYEDVNGNIFDTLEAWAYVTVIGPDMTITKTVDEATADPGDEIIYTIEYENTGTGPATEVVIVDTIDTNTDYVIATPLPFSVVGGVITWNIGTVTAGGSGSISLTVEVDAFVGDGTVLTNTATLDYDDANGNPQTQVSASVDVTVTAPDMTITKIADVTEADPGDQITYTITYSNDGTGEATDIVIVDEIDPNTSYVSANPAPFSVFGNIITWTIGSLDGGTITLIVTVNAYVEDDTILTNTVTLNYDDANGNPQDEETSEVEVTVTAPDMTITKTADVSEADPGDEITYTITYSNNGDGEATDVVIVDEIDPDTTIVSVSPTPTSIVDDVITWNFASVAGGGGGTITIVVEVDAYVVDDTILTNSVTLNYNDANGNPQDEEESEVDVTVTAPDMTITKTADVTEADPGDEITYTITYSNNGDGEATDVVIVDEIDPDTTIVSVSPTPTSIVDDVITWNFASVAGGGGGTITIVVEVDAYVVDDTILTNSVTLNYDDANGNPQDEESSEVDVTVTAPDMTITKTADVTEADPGDEIEYTITYSNNGDGEATDVVIVDEIDPDTTLVSVSPTPTSIVDDVITWNIASVAGGGGGTITIVVEVDAYVVDGTVLTNSVTLNYDDATGNPQDEESSEVDVTVTAPDMTITKTADVTEADPGDEIEYTITYSNNGDGEATDIVIVDEIDPDTTIVSVSPTPTSIVDDVITWNFASVAGGGGGTITIVVEVDAYVVDDTILTNSVTLNYDDANGNPQDEESSEVDVTVTAPDMSITKTADVTEADPGDEIEYTITYSNNGDGEATDVVIVDEIDPDTTLISVSPTPTSIVDDVITWNIASVAGGGGGTITIVVEVDSYVLDDTILTNSVTLNYDDANGNPQDEESSEVDVTVTAPDMTITKIADVAEADPGDEIEYTITYSNNGDGEATDIIIVDEIDPDTTIVSVSPTPTSIVDDVITWNFASVAGGGGGIITIVVEVDAYVLDGTVLTNSVTLNYDDATGNPQDEESSEVDVTVTAPDMTITKTADVSEADPGDEITYTITYSNDGTGDATDVTIVDEIDPDTTYVSANPPPDSISGDVLTWYIGTVDGGDSGTITIIVEVDAYVLDGTVLTNYVTLNYDDNTGNPQDEESSEVDVTVTAPDMTITKTADVSEADPGDQITYTITYSNNGDGEATDVVIEDEIDPDTTLISVSPTPTSIVDDVITWNIPSVEGGDGGTFTIVVEVDAYMVDDTILTNSVTLNYDDATGNPQDEESDEVDVTVTAPDMTMTKIADVTAADPGDEITYTITYSNNGDGEATDVVIVDEIDPDTTLISVSPTPTSIVDDVITWNIPSVDGGDGGTITIVVEVDAFVLDGTVLTNSVTLNYDDANGNPQDEESSEVDVTVTAPDMEITKTTDVIEAIPGDEIDYTITYENLGTGYATNVVIVDEIDPDTTYVSATPAPDSISGGTLTWNIGTVEGGDSGIITLTVEVNTFVDDGTVLTNWVSLNYNDNNSNPQDEETSEVDVTVTAPKMTFSKSADVTKADPGDTIIYTLDYENLGSGEATLVVVTDTIPSDVTFVSSNPPPDGVSSLTYTWDIGTVSAYSSGSIIITVTVNVGVDDGTLLHNTATFDYADGNGNSYPTLTGSADVTVTAPDMTFSKTSDVTEADPGDTIVYTLEYENIGSGDATLVEVTDIIPSDVSFVSSNPPPDGASGFTYTWDIGTVSKYSGGSITITVIVNAGVGDGTLLHNTASFEYADANGNYYTPLTGYADVTVTAPDMEITKTADVIKADPGDQIIYTIEYENLGTGLATDVVIVDTIDPDTTYISANPPPNSTSGDILTWNIGDVIGGGSGTILLTVTVDTYLEDGATLTNEVTLDYDDANGNPLDQESASADVTVTAPKMTLTKDANIEDADPGDTIVYTLEYSNDGSGYATDVVVKDTIPVGTTFVGSNPIHDQLIGSTYIWNNIISVAPYSGGTITITVTVDAGVDDGTLLDNLGTLNYDDANGNPYPLEEDHAYVTVTAPVMSITKTADVDDADPGDQIIYTITFINSGSGNARNVWINDTIPDKTTLVGTSPSYDDNIGDTYIWFYALITSGSSVTITVTVEVDVGTVDATTLHNIVTMDSSDDNQNYLGQESAFADVSVTAPLMTILKTADKTEANPGDTITYTIEYNNAGTGWATLVEIVDTIPEFTTFVSSDPVPDSSSGDEYTWDIGDLGPSLGGTIEIEVTVDVGTEDEKLLHNVGTLDYADANGNYYTQLSDYADVIVTAPELSIVKTADKDEANPGDTITYTIEYDNDGTGWATLVEIVDTIPEFTTFVSSTPAPNSSSGDEFTWNIWDLGPGLGGSIEIEVTVDVGTEDEKLLHNVGTLDYADANGNYYSQLSDYADVIVTAPELSILKTADKTFANPGDTIIYTIEYENSGTGLATLVEIVDKIPADTTFVSATPAPDSSSGDDYTWDIGNLGPGLGGTIEIEVTVDVGTEDEKLLHNVGTLDYADANGNYYTQLSDYADVIVTAPVLSIVKSADKEEANPGDTITYTIVYENSGTGLATLVKIVDTIPFFTTFVSTDPPHDSDMGREYTWDIGDLGPGLGGTIEIEVTVDVGTADVTNLHNEVTLDHADANGNYYLQQDSYADVIVTAPILSFIKTASVSEADPGDTIIYTLEYENSGTGLASLVKVMDSIPPETTFVGSTPAPDSSSGDDYTWVIGNLGPGLDGTIEIEVTVDARTSDTTPLWNTAYLDWADANGNYYPQLSDDALVTVEAPILSFSKTASVSEANPGDTIIYTLEYENSGTGWASLVKVMDSIPPETTFVGSIPAPNSSSGDDYTWNIWDLGPGLGGTIEIEVTVDVGTDDTTPLWNTGYLDWADPNGNYYPQLSDDALVTVTAPILTFSKSVSVSEADPGDTIIYTLEYENLGTGWASLVKVMDSIPPETTFVGSTPAPNSSSGDDYTWNIWDLGPGLGGSIEIEVTVDVGTDDTTPLWNTGYLDWADANGNYYPQLNDDALVTVTAPIMTMSKSADTSEVDPGDYITYTIDYHNSGTGWASGVLVNDEIPAHTTLFGSTPAHTTSSGLIYSWNIGFVEPGTGGSIEIVVQVIPGTPDETPLHNVGTLDYADANGNYYTQLSDFADAIVTAPIMSVYKTADVTEADPGDPITYELFYENTGTGDASSVTLVDEMPPEVSFVSATTPPDSIIGNILTWNIDDVASGDSQSIFVTVEVVPGTADRTPLINEMFLDYSDANDNFIEQLTDSVEVVVTAPVMTLSKEAIDINVSAYVIADFRLRVAGEKWHNVELTLYNYNTQVAFAEVLRVPGDPDDQSVTIHNVTVDLLSDSFMAVIEYTPFDDPNNGQWWGADPAWLILTLQDGSEVRLHHTFNVRHNDTWLWIVDDFRPYLATEPLTLNYTVSYAITYENIGSGDASDVWVYDTLPANTYLINSTPEFDSVLGNTYAWDIGWVESGEKDYIFLNASYIFENVYLKNWKPNGTLLVNEVALDYSDANGNFIEQLYDSAETLVFGPDIDTKKPHSTTPIETPEGSIPENSVPTISDGTLSSSLSTGLSTSQDGISSTPSETIQPTPIEEIEVVSQQPVTTKDFVEYISEISLDEPQPTNEVPLVEEYREAVEQIPEIEQNAEHSATIQETIEIQNTEIKVVEEELETEAAEEDPETEKVESSQKTDISSPELLDSPETIQNSKDSKSVMEMASVEAGISLYAMLSALLLAINAILAGVFYWHRIRKRR